jgi:hypothetical protein
MVQLMGNLCNPYTNGEVPPGSKQVVSCGMLKGLMQAVVELPE